MTQAAWDVGGDVHRALASIVRDPQLGTAVLADPHVMANLLKDLLPDLPRESALLVAAAQCDLTAAGTVAAWGSNDCGECDVPRRLSGVTAVAAGYGHSLVVVGRPS